MARPTNVYNQATAPTTSSNPRPQQGDVWIQPGAADVVYICTQDSPGAVWTQVGTAGSGDVNSVTAGAGITASPTTGNVVVTAKALIASGLTHQAGFAPDPGASAGTTKYLREDATWQVPPDTSGLPSGLTFSTPTFTVATAAANQAVLKGSATTVPVSIEATGSDASIPIKLAPKGVAGFLQIGSSTYGTTLPPGTGSQLLEGYIASGAVVPWRGIYIEATLADTLNARAWGIGSYVGSAVGGVNDADDIRGFDAIASSNLAAGHSTLYLVGGSFSAWVNSGNAGTATGLLTYPAGMYSAGGTLTDSIGFEIGDAFHSDGTITNSYGVLVRSQTASGTSTIGTLYGLKIEDLTEGSTNYAIKTGAGLVDFGGSVTVGTRTGTPATATAFDSGGKLVEVTGIDASITTADLVGKTITVTKGIITGYSA